MANESRWHRALIEGGVVVGSILLAFWIDASWDGRQARQLESDALSLVAAEIESNRDELAGVIAINDAHLDTIDRFLRATPEGLLEVPPDSVAYWVQSIQRIVTYNPNEEAAALLAQIVPLRSDGLRIRAVVAGYLRTWADAKEEYPVLIDAQNDMIGLVSRHAAREATSGLDSPPEMLARGGAGVLLDLRADDALVRGLIRKANWQRVYTGELREVLAALDSVSMVLR